jgi:signal transduction histidine kinase
MAKVEATHSTFTGDSLLALKSLALARAVLAVVCLISQVLAGGPVHRGVTPFVAAFAGYSLLVLFWRQKAGAALLSLIFDTIFFLVFATYGIDAGLWLSSVFYLYLLLSAVLLHHWWDTCIMVTLSIVFFSVTHTQHGEVLWRIVVWTGVIACVLSYLQSNIEAELIERAAEIDNLRSQVESVRDAERQRIAGDFHDGPLQGLISLQLRLEVLKKILERKPQAALQELIDLQELAKSQVSEVRGFLRGMRPVDVEGDNLVASLRRLVAEFQKDTGANATFQSGDRMDFDASQKTMEIIQILREALHNVQKHSNATQVAVTVKRVGDSIELAIEDNGVGFAFGGAFDLNELELLGLGPMSIRRRVRNLGGHLVVASRPGRGAALRITVPA